MKTLHTPHGDITFPAFFPVTTFGDKHPLDGLVRPYLKRTSQCLMLSHYYAQKMKKRPEMPIFIDSGGFAGLFEGSEFVDDGDHAYIKTKDGDTIKPLDVLRFQEKNADLGATLDFIIPPKTDEKEARRRLELTLKNAEYALRNRTPQSPLTLYASLQCWDVASARHAAERYVEMGFSAIAIGGLVPRARDTDYLKSIVSSVRKAAPNALIHVFGIGNPDIIPLLLAAGADSFDSSNYVRTAIGARENTHTPSGLNADLYEAMARLQKINSCFGVKYDIPNLQLFKETRKESAHERHCT